MLRAIDGHAKNLSLFLNPGGRYQLTPLYDVLSAWPVIGSGTGMWPQQEIRMAMAWYGTKSRTYKPLQIQRRRLISTAQKLGLGGTADTSVDELVSATPTVIDAVRAEVPSGFQKSLQRVSSEACSRPQIRSTARGDDPSVGHGMRLAERDTDP